MASGIKFYMISINFCSPTTWLGDKTIPCGLTVLIAYSIDLASFPRNGTDITPAIAAPTNAVLASVVFDFPSKNSILSPTYHPWSFNP